MLEQFKQALSLYLIVPVTLLIGIQLTLKFRGLQWRELPRAFAIVGRKPHSDTGLSAFTALAAVIGGNLGTGNIAGIAVALSTGGPGALFWMALMAMLGAIVKFVGCFLGLTYRQRGPKGWLGGPMFYLHHGVRSPKLAIAYSLFTLASALTVGNLVQINSITLPLTNSGLSPWMVGSCMAILVAAVLWGGAHYFSQAAAKIVPLMTVIYLGACGWILFRFHQALPQAIGLIIREALQWPSVVGGALGFTFWDALRVGFDRGLFATDAGVGLAPMLHAQVPAQGKLTETAYQQGLVSLIAPFIVIAICLVTGCVLLVTKAWQIPGLESTNVCIKAFQIGFAWAPAGHIITLTLCLFAFTTILTWVYCAQTAMAYLAPKLAPVYNFIFILVIPIGAFCNVTVVWTLADIALNGMLLLNLFAVARLSRQVQTAVTT